MLGWSNRTGAEVVEVVAVVFGGEMGLGIRSCRSQSHDGRRIFVNMRMKNPWGMSD